MDASLPPSVIRAKGEAAMYALLDSADNIADPTTRGHVASLIMSAIDNANDTVDVEGEEPAEEWHNVARRSLQCLIDCGGERVTIDVARWFDRASKRLT